MEIEELRAALGTAFQEYQRGVDAIDEAVADRLGINRTDLRIIDELSGGPQAAGELATRIGISPAAMTTALDRLERKGHARRIRDPEDRRKVLVELTDQTQAVCEEAMGPIAAEGEKLLAPYSEDELARFLEFMQAAIAAGRRHVERLRAQP